AVGACLTLASLDYPIRDLVLIDYYTGLNILSPWTGSVPDNSQCRFINVNNTSAIQQRGTPANPITLKSRNDMIAYLRAGSRTIERSNSARVSEKCNCARCSKNEPANSF